jgi:hypothetical protein
MAAVPATQSSVTAIAKELYPQKDINRLIIEDSAMLGLVPKRTDFYGKQQLCAMRYAPPAGRSAAFTNAMNNQAPSKLSGFLVTRRKDYALASIDTETIRSTSNDRGALVDALDLELGGAMEALRRSMAVSVFRNFGGAIGQLTATGSAAVTTPGPFALANPSDISNFEVGQVINLAATDGTTGVVKAGSVVVATVDRNLGTFTTIGNLNAGITPTAPALTDFIFTDGDFGNKIMGLDSWIPKVAPGPGDNFFNVDRSVDPERLAGVRPPTTPGAPIEQNIQQALGFMARNRSKPTHIFMNNADWQQLIIGLGSRTIFLREETELPEVGYDAVMVAGPKGNVKVLGDPNCPQGTAYILQMDSWCLWTLGEVGFLMEDDLRMLRDPQNDYYTFRLGYFGNLVCDAPGWNAVISI